MTGSIEWILDNKECEAYRNKIRRKGCVMYCKGITNNHFITLCKSPDSLGYG